MAQWKALKPKTCSDQLISKLTSKRVEVLASQQLTIERDNLDVSELGLGFWAHCLEFGV